MKRCTLPVLRKNTMKEVTQNVYFLTLNSYFLFFLKKHPLIKKKNPKNSKKFSSEGQLIPLFLFYFLPEYCSKFEVREDECDEVCCID